MSEQAMQILHLRKLRRDILLSRIERTRARIAGTAADLEAAGVENRRIERFHEGRARALRKSTLLELQGLKSRKRQEEELFSLKLRSEEISLAQEQMDLRRTEAKLDALQYYADDLLASVDDADDD